MTQNSRGEREDSAVECGDSIVLLLFSISRMGRLTQLQQLQEIVSHTHERSTRVQNYIKHIINAITSLHGERHIRNSNVTLGKKFLYALPCRWQQSFEFMLR